MSIQEMQDKLRSFHNGIHGEFFLEVVEMLENLSVAVNEQALSKDTVFIDHIKSHLTEGQEVVCKICGKTADEITKAKSRGIT